MKIENIELLKKIITIQACLIQGKSLKALLRMDQKYFLSLAKAKVITICVLESDKMYMEYIFEKDRLFEHLVKRYILSKNDFKCNYIGINYDKHLPKNDSHYVTSNFYDLYKGALSKKEANQLKKEISMEEIVIMPIYNITNKIKIANITYIFDKKENIVIENLKELKSFFESLIQTMYETEEDIFFSKCVRVDKHFHLLSQKERIIIKKVIKGESYIEISEDLGLTINTIKTHMKNIFNKYNVHSKIELYNKVTSHIFY